MKIPKWLSSVVIAAVLLGFVCIVFWNKTQTPTPLLALKAPPTVATNAQAPLGSPTPLGAAAAPGSEASATGPTPWVAPTPIGPPIDEDLNPMRKPLVQMMPTVSAMRDEARKNPHAVPQAGLAFAAMLGEREKSAITSEQGSKNLMAELEECGLTKDPQRKYPSVQAVCLETARELQDKWPSLKDRYDKLMKNTDPRAAGIARSTL